MQRPPSGSRHGKVALERSRRAVIPLLLEEKWGLWERKLFAL